LSGFDLTLKNPVFFVHDLWFIFLYLLLKGSLFFAGCSLLFVLKLDLSEIVELVIKKVFPFVFLLFLLFFIELGFFLELFLLLLELPFLLRVNLVFVGFELLIIDPFSIETHIFLAIVELFLTWILLFFFTLLPLFILTLTSFLIFLILFINLSIRVLLLIFSSFPVILALLLILYLHIFRFIFRLLFLLLLLAFDWQAVEYLLFVALDAWQLSTDMSMDLLEDLLVIHPRGEYGGLWLREVREWGY
jgi:hypothetical protein